MKVGPCSTSDVITFDENWHHLYSSSAGGKDLSNDTQIRVIGSIECEICMIYAKKFECENGRKISLNYTWLLCGKNFPS